MGSKGSTTVNTTQQAQNIPNPYTSAAGQQALIGAQGAAQQPFWLPPAPVAGFTPFQQAGFQNVANIQGQAQPWYNQAGQFAIGSQAPITGQDVAQYYNPMAQNVTAQMQNIFGQQNVQNTGNLVQAAGGVGADRIAVGQANLANQQGLAAGQTYSNLYQQALAAAQQQKQMQANAAYAMGNLGKGAQGANLQANQALLGAGGMQQQLAQAQMMSPYNWLQQQFAYPFQANQYLAGIVGGVGGTMGGQSTSQGTQVSTPAQPSPISQLLGLGIAGIGAYNQFGGGGGGGGGGGPMYDYSSNYSPSQTGYYGSPFFGNRGGRVPHLATGGTGSSPAFLPSQYTPVATIPNAPPPPPQPSAPSSPEIVRPTQAATDDYFSNTANIASDYSHMGPWTVGSAWHMPQMPAPGPEQSTGGFGAWNGLQPPQRSEYGTQDFAPQRSLNNYMAWLNGGAGGGWGGGWGGGGKGGNMPMPNWRPPMQMAGPDPRHQSGFGGEEMNGRSGGRVPHLAAGGDPFADMGAPVPDVPLGQSSAQEFPTLSSPQSPTGSGQQSSGLGTAVSAAMQFLPMLMMMQRGGATEPLDIRPDAVRDQDDMSRLVNSVQSGRTGPMPTPLPRPDPRPRGLPLDDYGTQMPSPRGGPVYQGMHQMRLAGDVVPGAPHWGEAARPTPDDRMRTLRLLLSSPMGQPWQATPRAPVLPIAPDTERSAQGGAVLMPGHFQFGGGDEFGGGFDAMPDYPQPQVPPDSPMGFQALKPAAQALLPAAFAKPPPQTTVGIDPTALTLDNPIKTQDRVPMGLAARADPEVQENYGLASKPVKTIPVTASQTPAPSDVIPPPGSPQPRPRPTQGGGPFGDLYSQKEQQYGLPPGYLGHTAYLESRHNPRSFNELSNARGLFQFTPSTARQYGLTNPWDVEASTDAAARLGRDNMNQLRQALGRDPTPAEIYLAHQQGAGGAARLLQNPNAPAGSVVRNEAIAQNAGSPGAPASSFTNMWSNRYDQQGEASDVSRPLPTSPRGYGAAQPSLYGMPQTSMPQGAMPYPGAPYSGRFAGQPNLGHSLITLGAGIAGQASPWAGVNIGRGLLEAQKVGREEFNTNVEAQKLGLDIQKHIDTMTTPTAGQQQQNWQQTFDPQTGKPYWTHPLYGSHSALPGAGPPGGGGLGTYGPAPGVAAGAAEAAGAAAPGQAQAPADTGPPPVGGGGTSENYAPPSDQLIQQFAGRNFDPKTGALMPDVRTNNQTIEKATTASADASRGTDLLLQDIQHNADIANSAMIDQGGVGKFLTKPGVAAMFRQSLAQGAITYLSPDQAKSMGIDPNAIGAITSMQKDTVRLGQAMTRLLGAREAAQIVNQSIAANPNWEQTEEGRIRVVASMQQALQREKDYQNFVRQWRARTPSLNGVQEAFDQANPADRYLGRANQLANYEIKTTHLPGNLRKQMLSMPKAQQVGIYDYLNKYQNDPKAIDALDKKFNGLGTAILGQGQQ